VSAFLDRLRTAYGVARSCWIYYVRVADRAARDRFYGRFVGAGELAFDVGAHVGDRIASFRRLGARVVAVEPQPALLRLLRWLYGRDRQVALEPVCVSDKPGETRLVLNPTNPTIASASSEFLDAAARDPGFQGQRWEGTLLVPTVTLDQLIEKHGMPRFIKIDVEGLEAVVLAGLTRPVPALSFEFLPMTRGIAEACLDQIERLGPYYFNVALGEGMRFEHAAPLDLAGISAWFAGLAESGPSGDVYCCLDPAPLWRGEPGDPAPPAHA